MEEGSLNKRDVRNPWLFSGTKGAGGGLRKGQKKGDKHLKSVCEYIICKYWFEYYRHETALIYPIK